MAETMLESPALLEGLPEAAFIASDWRVLTANSAALALLGPYIQGASRDEVISHPAAVEAL